MARKARKQSKTGFYHITNRGVNKADVFLDSEDHRRFIECLRRAHDVCDFFLVAYCIMTNHFHIIIRCNDDSPIPTSLFQSVGARFCAYYHRKYKTAGQVFQGRFRSEAIESEPHLLSAIRYVWNNPVEAGICNNAGAYPWSSFNLLGGDSDVVDNHFLSSLMTPDEWRSFTAQKNRDWHLEPFSVRNDDDIARAVIRKVCGRIDLQKVCQSSDRSCARVAGKCARFNISMAQLARIIDVPVSALRRRARRWRSAGKQPFP